MPTKIDPQTPFSPVKRSQNIRKSQVLVAKSHEAKIQQSLQLHHWLLHPHKISHLGVGIQDPKKTSELVGQLRKRGRGSLTNATPANSGFKSEEHMFQSNVNIDYVAVHVCPSRHPINTFWDEHLLDNLLPSLLLNLIFSAPERCWHCQKSLESLVHSPGNPEEMQSPPRSSEMHNVGPQVSLAQRTGNFDKLKGTFLKRLKWDDGTYGT